MKSVRVCSASSDVFSSSGSLLLRERRGREEREGRRFEH